MSIKFEVSVCIRVWYFKQRIQVDIVEFASIFNYYAEIPEECILCNRTGETYICTAIVREFFLMFERAIVMRRQKILLSKLVFLCYL